jgi:hypothetical protein
MNPFHYKPRNHLSPGTLTLYVCIIWTLTFNFFCYPNFNFCIYVAIYVVLVVVVIIIIIIDYWLELLSCENLLEK